MTTTKQKLKEALRQKIDSFDKWKQISHAVLETHPTIPSSPNRVISMTKDEVRSMYIGMDRYAGGIDRTVSSHDWWWWREQCRIVLLYPDRTDVMLEVIEAFSLGQYCIHPSTDPTTPEAVSYTPDAAMGQADRQVKLSSFGKLLRKLCILVSDEHVQKLEARHRAEMDPTFEIATTREEIEHVYRNMSGDSGCMRYGPDRWELPDDIHPSHVYSAPNMGVAYTKFDGAIKSRAVVWTDEAGVKKYLRIYGDGTLRRRLERAGYVNASLAGAKIAAIPLGDGYVVPYIDGMGGDQGNYDGTYGYIDSNAPQYIKLITRSEADAMDRAGLSPRQFKGHMDVVHSVPTFNGAEFNTTCAITGEQINIFSDLSYPYFDGTSIKRAKQSALAGKALNSAHVRIGTATVRVYSSPDTPMPTFEGVYFDNAETRAYLGYVKLDSEIYGSEVAWCKKPLARKTSDGRTIRESDAVVLLSYTPEGEAETICHESQVDVNDMLAQGYVNTPKIAGARYLAHKDHPHLRKLVSGRHAMCHRHDIVELYDGQWAIRRMATSFVAFGYEAYHLKTDTDGWVEYAPVGPLQSRVLMGVASSSELAYTYADGGASGQTLSSYIDSRLTSILRPREGAPRVIGTDTVTLEFVYFENMVSVKARLAELATVSEEALSYTHLCSTIGQHAAKTARQWIAAAKFAVTLRDEIMEKYATIVENRARTAAAATQVAAVSLETN